jgi:hypothetical protein|tara:strand:- start:588 stop:758 length:171 start_codon:yes stop_codon:yes gene_type:complete
MFNNTYSKIGLITTGLLSVGTAVYFYYYGGNPPFSSENVLVAKVIVKESSETDTEN